MIAFGEIFLGNTVTEYFQSLGCRGLDWHMDIFQGFEPRPVS